MARDLIISLDCSTSASKAIVWDLYGNILSEGRTSLLMIQPRLAWHEQPAKSWWSASCEAITQSLSHVNPKRVSALCIAHQRETFVPINERGEPLRNSITWMDERAFSLLPDIADRFGKDHFQEITGKPISGNLTVGKIEWLRRNEPKVFAETFKYLDVHAFLVYQLTGQYRTGWGCADPMGLFDMRKNEWSQEILSGIGVRPDQVPEAYPPGTVLGTVQPVAAKASNLPEGIPVVAGLGDGQSAGLGVNITQSGESYLSLGTSIVSGTFSDRYANSRNFRTMYGGLPGSYILETVLLGGAYTIKWFVDHFTDLDNSARGMNRSVEEMMDQAASEIPPGAEGLLLVPYWNSAMNPYWDAAASGIMVGWRGIHRRPHMYRAILEGIAFEQRLHTAGVEESLRQPIKRYIAVGGGAKNELWCQIIADITGKPVYLTQSQEATSLGAAILAAVGGGCLPDIRTAAEKMVHFHPVYYEPQPDRYRYYDQLYEEVYIHLYPLLQKYLDRLTELSTSYEENHPKG